MVSGLPIGCLVFPLFLLYDIVLYIIDVVQASWRMASIWSNMLELEAAKVCDLCSFCNEPRSCAYRRDTSLPQCRCMDVGKYLSYQEWGKKPSGRVRLQSGDAKRPMRWRVENLENNTFSLEAVRVHVMVLTCL